MSFDLSSIGRTRQKNSLFFLFIFMLIFFGPLFPPSGVQASESLISSVASPNSVGRASGEFDSIDSFDVHPSSRWTETNEGFNAVIDNGLLNMSDEGDASADLYRVQRDLRDLSGTIEVRFKYDVVGDDGTDFNDGFYVVIIDTTIGQESNHYIRIRGSALKDDAFSTQSFIEYRDVDHTLRTKTLAGDERFFDNIWYVLRLDYDILESSIRYRLFFDNGSKVFDYNWQDISTTRPAFFAVSTPGTQLQGNVKASGYNASYYWDYVNAPFKEREWTQTTAPSDSDWLSVSWQGAHFQDDINSEDVQYSLVVPYLDMVSGSIETELFGAGDPFPLAINDDISMSISLSGVDVSTGDIDTIVSVLAGYQAEDANPDSPKWAVFTPNGTILSDQGVSAIPGNGKDPHVSFVISLNEERTQVVIKGDGWLDDTNDTTRKSFLATLDVADFVDEPSQEFIISVNFHIGQFVGDAECTMLFSNVVILEKDVFHDFGGLLGEPPAPDDSPALVGSLGIFQGLFDAIAGFIDFIFGALFETVNNILNIIDDSLGVIATAIEAIAADIWGSIGTALDFITDAVDDIWNILIATLDDVIAQLILLAEDAGDFVFAVIEFLIVLALDIVGEIVAVIEATVFFIWDAIGLPDVIEIFNLTLAYIIELVQWLVLTIQDVILLAADLSWLILVGWWVWAVPVQWGRAAGNPLGGLGNFIEAYSNDLIPWTIFGIHVYVPQGIVFTLWMILLLPADFAIFTALGI